MLQLIDEDIKIYILDLKNYVGKSNYSMYFSHHQENSVLLKTMSGDVSDSIKGIKGLGEKTLLTFFPELNERKVNINEIIEKSKVLQLERVENKQKPLKVLDNIINSVTDGVQGDKIYEINERLVNLKKPMMTEEGINDLNELMNNTLDFSNRELKNVLAMMKEDGLENKIGEYRYPDFLTPFKKLIDREKKNF
jgi:5'-3' exonuclease